MSVTDRKRLRDGAGGECSFPDCPVRENLEEAHLVAERADGPRGDAAFTRAQLDSYDNRILLCPNHHTIVDGNPTEWTVDKLRRVKAAHEQDVARRLASTPNEGTASTIEALTRLSTAGARLADHPGAGAMAWFVGGEPSARELQ